MSVAPNVRPPQRTQIVLELVSQGLCNKEIAGRLQIAESTVKWHVSRLLVMYETPNRAGVVREAIARGDLVVSGRTPVAGA